MCPVVTDLINLLSERKSISSEDILKELDIAMTTLVYIVCVEGKDKFQMDEDGVVSFKQL